MSHQGSEEIVELDFDEDALTEPYVPAHELVQVANQLAKLQPENDGLTTLIQQSKTVIINVYNGVPSPPRELVRVIPPPPPPTPKAAESPLLHCNVTMSAGVNITEKNVGGAIGLFRTAVELLRFLQ